MDQKHVSPNPALDIDDMGFSRGMTWGVLLSIPLWLSFFGWLKLIIRLLPH